MASGRSFQAPKGTRDFYPADMAVRRHLESIWRSVSINHGFEEIDGPTFEHLDLYTAKSGPGIVNELFSFRRAGGEDDYALRPEFTPTLARMVAARGGELPKPIRWFCMPMFFRAERPQRGRLREFQQWNVDLIGDDSPRADAEIISVAVGVLQALGLSSKQITIKLSHRELIAEALTESGVPAEQIVTAMNLLDRREKLEPAQFAAQSKEANFDFDRFQARASTIAERINSAIGLREQAKPVEAVASAASPSTASPSGDGVALAHVLSLVDRLAELGILKWCEFDLGIVRGLAYYTGTVFEIHESSGKERAIAGGGRYDKLIELLGGPSMPAVGFAMGDVVIRLVLEDFGLVRPAEEYLPRPDAFLISAGGDESDGQLPQLLASLRQAGLHVRTSSKTTKNVGKLLGDAAKCRARFAVILGEELSGGLVQVKDMERGEQAAVAVDSLAARLRGSPADPT